MIEIARGIAIVAGLFGASMGWGVLVTPIMARWLAWSGQP